MPPPSLSPTPTILLPHLPPKTLVGIDLITFTSTANFHGIRDLPEGWHFLYTGTTESFSLRCGAWFYVGDISVADAAAAAGHAYSTAVVQTTQQGLGGAGKTEIRIWRWDQNVEALVPLRGVNDAEKQEAMRHKANLGAVWQRGGLFGYRSRVPPSRSSSSSGRIEEEHRDEEDKEEGGRSDWVGLTCWISPQLLSRVLGDAELDIDGRPRWTVTSASTAAQDADNITGLKGPGAVGADGVAGEQEKELRFLPVDLKRTWREGAIGRERTEAARDRSWALGDLIRRFSVSSADERTGEAQVLGELQFTFLMVLTMMNFSCLEQWKRLLSLILTCRAAIKDKEMFFRNVLRLLRLQLRRCDDVEGGLFEMNGDDGGAFLRKLLTNFKRTVDEIFEGAGSMVKTELDELEKWVKREYGWELRREAIVRRGMLQLEDGEQVEMELNDSEADDETGEYAPIVVDLGEGGGDESQDAEDVDMQDFQLQ
ncbi:hypothetical protein VTN02DRAFT_24 [Thermoascus thermophilus]